MKKQILLFNKEIKMIRCCDCKETKPETEFYKDKNKNNGHGRRCKKCGTINRREYCKKYPEKCRMSHTLWREKNPIRSWASCTLKMHRAKGFTVNISLNELVKRVGHTPNCEICGRKLGWGVGRKKPSDDSPTLDRLNNGKIINLSSILILCHPCNTTKRNRTLQEFIDYCRKVVKWADSSQPYKTREVHNV